jgi:hypothetical protein
VSDQLSLFGAPEAPPLQPRPSDRALAERHERARTVAARLPSSLAFGTSSWAFPGGRVSSTRMA